MIKLIGWNTFYEGWLDGHFNQSPDLSNTKDCGSYGVGYRMARETNENDRWLAFRQEMELNHIKVEQEKINE